MGRLFDPVSGAEQVLNAVERWATGYELLREFGGADLPGRFDGLLIPTGRNCNQRTETDRWWWERFGLAAVEVKTDRSDFLAALGNGQFEKYRDFAAIAGVYLAAPRGIARTDELPAGVGHLIVGWGAPMVNEKFSEQVPRCICRRKPAWRVTSPEVALMWRIIFALNERYWQRQRERQEEEHKVREGTHSRLARMLWAPLRRIEAEAERALIARAAEGGGDE